MKKIMLTVLCWMFCFLASGKYVATDYYLYKYEKQAMAESFDKNKIQDYVVKKGDSVEECFKKLVFLFRSIADKHLSLYFDFGKSGKLAYDMYPNEPAIVALYAKFLAIEKDKDFVKIILPCIQEYKSVPLVMDTLYTYFENCWCQATEKEYFFKLQCKRFNVNTKEELRHKILVIKNYWLSFLNEGYMKHIDEYRKAKAMMENIKLRHEAIETWGHVIEYQLNLDRNNMKADLTVEIINGINEKNKKNLAERKKADIIAKKRVIQQTLDSLKYFENKNFDFNKMMLKLAMLGMSKNITSKFKNIPNYDKLKGIYKDSQEAEIINCAYILFSLRDKNRAFNLLQKLDQNNPKVLMLQVRCLMRSKKEKRVLALKYINKYLELKPNDTNAKIIKVRLEDYFQKVK